MGYNVYGQDGSRVVLGYGSVVALRVFLVDCKATQRRVQRTTVLPNGTTAQCLGHNVSLMQEARVEFDLEDLRKQVDAYLWGTN